MCYPTLDAALDAARAIPEANWAGVCIAEALDGAGFGLSLDLMGVGSSIGDADTVYANGWHHPARVVHYLAPRSAGPEV